MQKQYTTTEAAKQLDLSVAQVRVVARKIGVGSRFGRAWVFSADDIETMRKRDTTPGPKPDKRKAAPSEE